MLYSYYYETETTVLRMNHSNQVARFFAFQSYIYRLNYETILHNIYYVFGHIKC